uniref:Nucleolar complex associated 4 homolog n=1 Tax=Phocoena sinus TaxID=42100 RepID=A0A8C9CCT7_PHOSS
MEGEAGPGGARRALGRLVEAVLANRGKANSVFDILAVLQSEDQEEVHEAVRACKLFVGQLPSEEMVMAGSRGATRKYKVWMRHRYHSCCNRLGELLARSSFPIKELALSTLMKFVQLEGEHPLEKPKWEGNYLFPYQLFKVRPRLPACFPPEEDRSLLLCQFRESTWNTTTSATTRCAQARSAAVPLAFWNNAFTLLSSVSLPRQESVPSNFYVKHAELSDKWKVVHLREHRKAFQQMWLRLSQLPLRVCKKVLVIMHDSILPHLAQPSLMIDFLARACDVGEAGSTSLALNGLFILIHKHNLEYPDFYRKLYGLLDPSVFHVKYGLASSTWPTLFLSSSHLPAYLVAAFTKRLALLTVLPFICNLLRRHPACRVLVHRPRAPGDWTPTPMTPREEDPARSRALESSLWELQALSSITTPSVSKAASGHNQALSEAEVSIAPLLELTAFPVFEQDLQKKGPEPVPLEFSPAPGLLGRRGRSLCPSTSR